MLNLLGIDGVLYILREGLEPVAKCITVLLALFNCLGIRLMLERQTTSLDNNHAKLQEQKHEGITALSKGVTKEICNV